MTSRRIARPAASPGAIAPVRSLASFAATRVGKFPQLDEMSTTGLSTPLRNVLAKARNKGRLDWSASCFQAMEEPYALHNRPEYFVCDRAVVDGRERPDPWAERGWRDGESICECLARWPGKGRNDPRLWRLSRGRRDWRRRTLERRLAGKDRRDVPKWSGWNGSGRGTGAELSRQDVSRTARHQQGQLDGFQKVCGSLGKGRRRHRGVPTATGQVQSMAGPGTVPGINFKKVSDRSEILVVDPGP